MKIKIYLTILCSIFCGVFLIACSDNFEKPPGKEEIGKPDPNVVFQGSFASKFSRYAKGDNFTDTPLKIWSDTLWQNDRSHKQLILWAEKGEFRKLSYTVSDLKSENKSISKNNIQIRFGEYVKGDALALDCGGQGNIREAVLQADALSPEKRMTLSSDDDPLKLWITLNIPAETVPGRYTGTIVVKEGTVEIDEFELDILVVNHKLPDVKDWSFHLDLWHFPYQLTKLVNQNGNDIEMFSDQYFKLIKPFYTMLADAGQVAITTYIKDGAFEKDQTMVKWTKKTDGSWAFDYTNFDQFVEKMMSWGIDKQINCFSLVGWDTSIRYYDEANGQSTILPLDVSDTEYANIWNEFLTSFHTHLVEKGWFDKTVLYMDEIEESKMEKVVEVVKMNSAEWKIGLTGKAVNSSISSKLYDYSVILGHQRSHKTPISTFYTSCSHTSPNNYITPQNSPAEMTWMAWHAAANDYNGYLRWAYDYWINIEPTDIHDGDNTAGDFSMIYRSDNTLSSSPISSIRLELMREGIQDYEKIKILSNNQLNSFLDAFDEESGTNSLKLVSEGQSLIKEISSKD